jgi:Family of unknown function (DUF5923)/Protein of unknown function (DUF4449)
LENLVVESENLMPNILELQVENFFRFGRKRISSRNAHSFYVHVSQIQCDLKDVAYWIKKKGGFPNITDTGLMDLFLGGQGLSFDMKLATAQRKDSNRIFKVESVTVKVKNLNIVLKKSNHKLLFNLFKPLLLAVVKPAVAKAAEIQIRKSFDKLDEQLWLVQNEYNKAKDAAKDQPPEETSNMVNMYIQAIQKRITEIKEKAKEKTPDAKVCYPFTSFLIYRLILQLPRRLHYSPTSISQVVFPPRPPSTARWLVRDLNGDLQSSISAQLKPLPISPNPRRLPANLLINQAVALSTTVVLVLPLPKIADTLL